MELFHLFDGKHFAGEEIRVGLVERWLKKGLKPVDGLVSDVSQFVKDTSDL